MRVVIGIPYLGLLHFLRPLEEALRMRGHSVERIDSTERLTPPDYKERVLAATSDGRGGVFITASAVRIPEGIPIPVIAIPHGSIESGKSFFPPDSVQPDYAITASWFTSDILLSFGLVPKKGFQRLGYIQTDWLHGATQGAAPMVFLNYDPRTRTPSVTKGLYKFGVMHVHPLSFFYLDPDLSDIGASHPTALGNVDSFESDLKQAPYLICDFSSVIGLFLTNPDRRIFVHNSYRWAHLMSDASTPYFQMRGEVGTAFSTIEELAFLIEQKDIKADARARWRERLFAGTDDGKVSARITAFIESLI